MVARTACQIRCLNCNRWIDSPIGSGTAEAFFTSSMVGTSVRCPFCKTWTSCNKENMRFMRRRADGGVTYIEGKDAFSAAH
ncbi:MAG: hypothetical protein ABSB83_02000 [Methanomassiliicoccales archaeon]